MTLDYGCFMMKCSGQKFTSQVLSGLVYVFVVCHLAALSLIHTDLRQTPLVSTGNVVAQLTKPFGIMSS
jgi:hypothetical protein